MNNTLKTKSNDLNYEIGNRLRELRENKGLQQERFIAELADLGLTISKSTYSRYECGITPIPFFHLKMFCDYFNVTTDYLINGTEKITPDEKIAKILKLLTLDEKKVIRRFMTDIANSMEEKQPVSHDM